MLTHLMDLDGSLSEAGYLVATLEAAVSFITQVQRGMRRTGGMRRTDVLHETSLNHFMPLESERGQNNGGIG